MMKFFRNVSLVSATLDFKSRVSQITIYIHSRIFEYTITDKDAYLKV